jgi:hypothetical protein
MAESLAHRWGQIIGDVFEAFVRDILTGVATKHGLYLDFKRPRNARGGQGKVTWRDAYGNKHDLDYVLERGGTEDALGVPVAFVESAWRRYTKHSKNKAQEIEAAVMPVALNFASHQPFCGAVIAGEFTRNALHQLESKGFVVLHIPYASILSAFREHAIDASSEDGVDGTSEVQFRKKIQKWAGLSQPKATGRLLRKLRSLHAKEIAVFVHRMEDAITRRVASVLVSILRGQAVECPDVCSAIACLLAEEHGRLPKREGQQRESFEIQVRFSNSAKIDARFPTRTEAIVFLQSFQQP